MIEMLTKSEAWQFFLVWWDYPAIMIASYSLTQWLPRLIPSVFDHKSVKELKQFSAAFWCVVLLLVNPGFEGREELSSFAEIMMGFAMGAVVAKLHALTKLALKLVLRKILGKAEGDKELAAILEGNERRVREHQGKTFEAKSPKAAVRAVKKAMDTLT